MVSSQLFDILGGLCADVIDIFRRLVIVLRTLFTSLMTLDSQCIGVMHRTLVGLYELFSVGSHGHF